MERDTIIRGSINLGNVNLNINRYLFASSSLLYPDSEHPHIALFGIVVINIWPLVIILWF